MARVICTLPNASDHINGVAFVQTEGGWLSDPVDDATARRFADIPGYQLVAALETAPSPFVDPAKRPARPAKASPE